MGGYGGGGYGAGGYGGGGSVSPTLPYYLGLLTSQYQNPASPNLRAFLALLLQPFLDTLACAQLINAAYDVNAVPAPVGDQLNVVGQLVGASRQLPFVPVGVSALTTVAITSTGVHTVTVNNTNYMSVGVPQTITGSDSHTETVTPTAIVTGVSFTANFTLTHVTNSSVTNAAPSSTLSDADYLTLIRARIIWNQWDGQADSLWFPLQTLFPGCYIYITDNQNMTCTIKLVGNFSSIQQQMIANDLIIPRPEAVAYTSNYSTTPSFGFDNTNPVFVQGFDIGEWN
jgi:hypothetical protein